MTAWFKNKPKPKRCLAGWCCENPLPGISFFCEFHQGELVKRQEEQREQDRALAQQKEDRINDSLERAWEKNRWI